MPPPMLSEPARGFSVLATDGDQSPPVNFQAGMQQPGILQPAEPDSLSIVDRSPPVHWQGTRAIDSSRHGGRPHARSIIMSTPAVTLVGGDIGGTNARLQLWEASAPDDPSPALVLDRRYSSRDYDGLEPLLRTFLVDAGFPVPEGEAASSAHAHLYGGPVVHGCCIAICGPVDGENVQSGPNLPEQGPTGWGADAARDLGGRLGAVIRHAVLINDFVAVGLGLTVVPEEDLATLHEAPQVEGGVKAAVGAGTGLGEVTLVNTHAGSGGGAAPVYVALPCEGGMTEFLAHDEQEWRLREWLRRERKCGEQGTATVEGVVSGPGLANVFEFLLACDSPRAPAAAAALAALPRVEQPAAIAAAALEDEGGGGVAARAVALMLRAYGAELRQVALRAMPSGGLYIAGGIAPKLAPKLHVLVDSYCRGDALMASVITSFPLFLCTNDDLGLLGSRVRAARCCLDQALAPPPAANNAQL
jgi:glucokinase